MSYDDMKQSQSSLKVSFNFSVARTSNSICYILGLTPFIFEIITNTIHRAVGSTVIMNTAKSKQGRLFLPEAFMAFSNESKSKIKCIKHNCKHLIKTNH